MPRGWNTGDGTFDPIHTRHGAFPPKNLMKFLLEFNVEMTTAMCTAGIQQVAPLTLLHVRSGCPTSFAPRQIEPPGPGLVTFRQPCSHREEECRRLGHQ